MNLFEVAKELSDRLQRIFLRDGKGRRPVFGGSEKFQKDPQWRDSILFYKYFHGTTARASERATKPVGPSYPPMINKQRSERSSWISDIEFRF
jgi:hypothetical protein